MRCCGRFLLLALLLLPAGLGNGAATLPPNASLLPAPSEGIPVGRDATLGSRASATVSVTQMSAGATGWESGSTVPTAAVTGTGSSSASSASWESSSPGSTPGSQPAVPTATPTGDVVEEPTTAPGALATTLPQAPPPATASSSVAPQASSSQPRASPLASSPSQGTPATITTSTATPGPPLPEVTAAADKTGPATGVTVQEVPRALSSGSIVAITLTVIVTVVLVFSVAAYLKIRHSSYGRLLDNHDYGSWGSYNNPLYDDS